MTQHTPGPWHVENFHGSWDVTHGPADDASERFSVLETLSEENARLIAAAPDLLAACKEALGYEYGQPGLGWRQRIDLLEAAIAKAEGRKRQDPAGANPAGPPV